MLEFYFHLLHHTMKNKRDILFQKWKWLLGHYYQQVKNVSQDLWDFSFKLFSERFDIFFRVIFWVFILALLYEVLMRFVFPYYTLGRVSILFWIVALIFLWKGIIDKRRVFLDWQSSLEKSIENIFYGYLIVWIVLLFGSLYFPVLNQLIPMIFTGGIIVFSLFKYFWKKMEFAQIDILTRMKDNIKKWIIFLCFTVLVFIPFLYTAQLYQYKNLVLFFLILIEILLIWFIVMDRSHIKRRHPVFWNLKNTFKTLK